MPIDLASVLPVLLPKAIDWATAQSDVILRDGEPLSDTDISLAAAVGVSQPERVRICAVPEIPLPEDQELNDVALETGLLGPNVIGITFGFGIYLREGFKDNRLTSHECRHVHQYEVAGSIGNFLEEYLKQIVEFGYEDAPFEVDARIHELHAV